MNNYLLKKSIAILFLLILVQVASADLFIVSVEKWINCKEYNNETICEKNPEYGRMEKQAIPNINTNYYDQVIEEVVKSKNEKISTLENSVTGYATQSSEIKNMYSSMEKVYIIGLVILSALLVNAYYQIYKLKKKK